MRAERANTLRARVSPHAKGARASQGELRFDATTLKSLPGYKEMSTTIPVRIRAVYGLQQAIDERIVELPVAGIISRRTGKGQPGTMREPTLDSQVHWQQDSEQDSRTGTITTLRAARASRTATVQRS